LFQSESTPCCVDSAPSASVPFRLRRAIISLGIPFVCSLGISRRISFRDLAESLTGISFHSIVGVLRESGSSRSQALTRRSQPNVFL
jgi:hypothetical protein